MSNPLVSVIVPIYNTESYLNDCLDSVISQTYDNIEVILVDDGSTDNSREIALEYRNMDRRIKYFYKENGGLSSARNKGIEECKGEYLFFLDSDDMLVSNAVSRLVEIAIGTGSEIVCGKVQKFLDGKNVSKKHSIRASYQIFNATEALLQLFYRQIQGYACGKLFLKSVFAGVKFPEGKLYEDLFTIPGVFERANYISTIEDIVLLYRQRSESIVHLKASRRQFDVIDADQKWVEYFQDNDFVKKAAINHLYFDTVDYASKLDGRDCADLLSECIPIVKRCSRTVLIDKKTQFNLRMLSLLSLFIPKITIKILRRIR